MDTTKAKLTLYNIVVVYRELRLGTVLRELARNLLPGHPSPLITEIPDRLLVVIYPERQLQCQFANRRVDVSDRRGIVPGTEPFGQVAVNAINAATTASRSDIVAYGYNFHLDLPLENAGSFILTRFFRQPDQIGEAFGGTVEHAGIKASIRRPDCQANFDLEPARDAPGLVRAHINYHYQGKFPPDNATSLSNEIDGQYRLFLSALDAL